MNPRHHIAIIGSGATAIYLLMHLHEDAEFLSRHIGEISIFEKAANTGMGMPYNPETTDRFNMSNISSEELPTLPETLGTWLREQPRSILDELGIGPEPISDSEVYPRLALGRYLKSQYLAIIARLAEVGIIVHEYPDCEVTDILPDPDSGKITLLTPEPSANTFDRVIIAAGHRWKDSDAPGRGFYASPWPIHKLLPPEGNHHNFPIGTLGASLSAYDVISSLAHRHGRFVAENGALTYIPHPGTEGFKLSMHAAEGLLPHLQFDQVKPLRKIYRHIDRPGLLSLVDDSGFLRLNTYFDKVCRPALIEAMEKDRLQEIARLLQDPDFSILDFAEKMSDRHDYPDAFEGMRIERIEAHDSVDNHRPIHWKEILDDLLYTLNFHAELLSAEDHITLRSEVLPFVMNVMAALPLPSADTLLALRDAGKIDLIPGKVSIEDADGGDSTTTITVEDSSGETSTIRYRMFIDCSGQKPLEIDDYPFTRFAASGGVRRARARFQNPRNPVPESKAEHVHHDEEGAYYHTGGIDVDSAYRIISADGTVNRRIHDLSFPHISGQRPYSYGLQACSDTSEIVARAIAEEYRKNHPISGSPVEISKLYPAI